MNTQADKKTEYTVASGIYVARAAEATPWCQTFSGVAFDLLAPKPEQVRLVDIAHHLSRIVRFSGATRGEYGWSVAQHSLLAESLVPDETDAVSRLHVLLHDAHEAYVGDVTTPVKRALVAVMRSYGMQHGDPVADFTNRIDLAIWRAFGMGDPTTEQTALVADVDLKALWIEKSDLMAPEPLDWSCFGPLDDVELKLADNKTRLLVSPNEAKNAFVDRFNALMAMRHGL